VNRSSRCQNCGAGLEQRRGRGRPRKFCSTICTNEFWDNARRGLKPYRVCSWCLGSFISRDWQRRYCAPRCNQKARKARTRFLSTYYRVSPPLMSSHQYRLRRTGARLCKCGCGMYTRAKSGYFVGGWTPGEGRGQGTSHRPKLLKPIQPEALPCLGECGQRTRHESGLCSGCAGRSRPSQQHARSNAIRQLLDELGMSRQLLSSLNSVDRAQVMKNVEAALGLR
jgi:hypothetical protein